MTKNILCLFLGGKGYFETPFLAYGWVATVAKIAKAIDRNPILMIVIFVIFILMGKSILDGIKFDRRIKSQIESKSELAKTEISNAVNDPMNKQDWRD
ncbi:hypothetical protein [Undibacterium sp. TS12]|uniref:hypothetical protein n=1 Tax=Undibacterium sp. TS12 TaxID=2908202 RepID=UPI001F4CFBFF|nr:hypothetical protein [Undibacterium sp. TS12]MCH8621074.1 hypothetical protein [Undibacterium sp. TS12]